MTCIESAFGNWFAGFVDGEGCFMIDRFNNACWFQLWLRDDDVAIVEEIRDRLGFGRIHRSAAKTAGSNSKPRIAWYVSRQADTQRLVEVFDQFPLRAKKARDFEIWKEAVSVKRWRSGSAKDRRLAELRERLNAGRVYEAPEPPPAYDDGQLCLVGLAGD
jgi:hypothetical protein